MRHLTIGLVLLAFASVGGVASPRQQNAAAANVDIETLGPKVGDVLPNFNLRDQSGQLRTLKSLLGPKGAVIVFFRSADW